MNVQVSVYAVALLDTILVLRMLKAEQIPWRVYCLRSVVNRGTFEIWRCCDSISTNLRQPAILCCLSSVWRCSCLTQ